MADLTTKSEFKSALERAKARMASVKKEARAVTSRAVQSTLTGAAGYAVGLARNKMGTGADKKILFPGTQMEADLVIGLGLTLAGISGLADDYSEELTAVGSGVLAGYAAIAGFTGGLPGDLDSRFSDD